MEESIDVIMDEDNMSIAEPDEKIVKNNNNINNENNHNEIGNTFSEEEEEILPPLPPPKETDDIEEFVSSPNTFKPSDELLNNFGLQNDDTLLTHCVRNLYVEAVKVLLEREGVKANELNKKGVTPISAAATKGSTDIILPLIDHGADVDALNSSGSTALIQASHFGHYDAVNLLLQKGARADFANIKGTTALMRASQEGHVQICELLIDRGADVNRKNHEGMNALMLASQRGHAEMARLLTAKSADVDEQTAQGSTALMLACKRGHEKVVEVLVSMGAEIYIRDRRHRTARDTAVRRNQTHLINLLDTKVQRDRIRASKLHHRSLILQRLEKACLDGNLVLTPAYQRASTIYEQNIINKEPTQDPADAETLAYLNDSIQKSYVLVPTSAGVSSRKGYADWLWPYLLYKSMSLPKGLFALICSFIPPPRVWHWQLIGLKRRRCRLAPHQAILDLSSIIDDILTDANTYVQGNDQVLSLVKLSRNHRLQEYLIHNLGMDQSLIDSLALHSDVQSLAERCNENEVTFKYAMAKKMLQTTIKLYKWQLLKQDPDRAMGLGGVSSDPEKLGRSITANSIGDDTIGSNGSPHNDQDTETEIDVVPDEDDALEVLEEEQNGSENDLEDDDGSASDENLMDIN